MYRMSVLPLALAKALLVAALTALCISGCAAPVSPTPTAIVVTPMPAKSSTLAATITTPSAPVTQTVIVEWEEMFRVTKNYEYVKTNGRPGDKEWWIEQAKRFYIGRARAEQLQQIEMMFKPDVPGSLGFIQDARYTVEVQNCSSATECVLQVRVQSGQYWAYDIHQKNWNEANPVEPAVWIIPMRYDSTTGHWKVN